MKVFEIELVNYLGAIKIPIDLNINFGDRKIEFKIKVKELQERINRIKKIRNRVHPVILSKIFAGSSG